MCQRITPFLANADIFNTVFQAKIPLLLRSETREKARIPWGNKKGFQSVQLPVSLWSTHLSHLRVGHHGGRHQISGDIHGSSKCPCCPCTLSLHSQTLGRNTEALPQTLVMLAFAPSRKEKKFLRITRELGMQSTPKPFGCCKTSLWVCTT